MLTNSPVTPTKRITRIAYSTLRLNSLILLMGIISVMNRVNGRDAKALKDALADNGIMVRYYSSPAVLAGCIRISVGKPEQVRILRPVWFPPSHTFTCCHEGNLEHFCECVHDTHCTDERAFQFQSHYTPVQTLMDAFQIRGQPPML